MLQIKNSIVKKVGDCVSSMREGIAVCAQDGLHFVLPFSYCELTEEEGMVLEEASVAFFQVLAIVFQLKSGFDPILVSLWICERGIGPALIFHFNRKLTE